MDIDIKKNGKVRLLNTPYFKPINDTNISFTNMDIGTAKITFELLKDGRPMPVSEKNVDVYAFLESRNGSKIEVPLEFEDPFKGIVSLSLDKDFLEACTNSTVEGQLYITMHKKNDTYNDYSNTVALQRFEFAVEDALINQITGKTKIEYIRSFDNLKIEVREKIEEMQENIGEIETLVKEINDLFDEVTANIKATQKQTLDELKKNSDTYNEQLDEKRSEIIEQIETKTTNSINQIDNKKQDILNMLEEGNIVTKQIFEEYKSDIQDDLNETLNGYKNDITSTKEDLKNSIDDLDWQKHILTNDNGDYISVDLKGDLENMKNLESKFYYFTNTPNLPETENKEGFGIVLTHNNDQLKRFIFMPATSSSVYVNTLNQYNWSGWQKNTLDYYNSGWQALNLINGAQEYGSKHTPKYKLTILNDLVVLSLKGAVKNITSSRSMFASLPKNVLDKLNPPHPYMQSGSLKDGKATAVRLSLESNGNIGLIGVSYPENMSDSDFYPIDTTITL